VGANDGALVVGPSDSTDGAVVGLATGLDVDASIGLVVGASAELGVGLGAAVRGTIEGASTAFVDGAGVAGGGNTLATGGAETAMARDNLKGQYKQNPSAIILTAYVPKGAGLSTESMM
jgi:hypothetical protein